MYVLGVGVAGGMGAEEAGRKNRRAVVLPVSGKP